MDNQAKTRNKPRKPSARPELEPISYDEIMANAGMSGFVSFLDAPAPEPPAVNSPAAPVDPWLKPDTVQETSTVQRSKVGTVQKVSTVQEKDRVQETGSVQPVGTAVDSYTVSDHARAPRRWQVRRTRGVEDGHSLAEQEVYRTLWKVGASDGNDPEASRTVRIGYDRLAALVRLSWVTVKSNLRSLEKKLAIEVVAAEDSANREGKQYRVYSSAEILARRQSAGLLWVRRTRGVELLANATGSAVEQGPSA